VLAFLAAAATAHAECPGSGRLQESMILVSQANPVLTAERAIFDEQQRHKPWEASVTVGFSDIDTLESGAAGPNAALRVRIPLWDRSTLLKVSERKAAWLAKEAATRAALLAVIQSLCEQAHQVRALNTLRKFARDRLTYRQERVDQGIDVADSLWAEAEAMQSAEHKWKRESGKLATRRLTAARQYGGERGGPGCKPCWR
jgi:hypothetical protein